ncbi:658_t:CDS:2, partial [Acaulospora colombiana]
MGKPSGKNLVAETNGKGEHRDDRRKPSIKKQGDIVMRDASLSGSESDIPLARRMTVTNGKKKSTVNGQSSDSKQINMKVEEESSESDSQVKPIRRRPKRIVVSEESEDDVPLAQVTKSTGSSSKLNKNKSSAPVKEEKTDNNLAKRKRMDSESEGDDRNIVSKNDPKKSNKKVTPKKGPDAVVKKEHVETTSREASAIKRMGKTNGKKTVVVKHEPQDSDSDVPLAKRMANKVAAIKPSPSKEKVATTKSTAKAESVKQEAKTSMKNNKTQVKRKRNDSDSEFDDKKQVAKAKSSKSVAKKSEPERKKKKEAESSDNKMSEKKRGKQKAKSDVEEERDDEEEDDEFKWWSQQNAEDDGSVKWTSLEHNGVYFPPPYVPHNVKMKYDGKEITLSPEAEEVASFYAAMINTDYGKNPTFIKNFFKDWKEVLAKSPMNPKIDDFSKCDFGPINEHFEREKELKKSMTKEEKARLKEEKLRLEEKYGY